MKFPIYKRVTAALRDGEPMVISGAIMRWLDRLDPGVRPARLDLFLRDHGDGETLAAAAALARCLAQDETFAEARTLGRGLNRARKHLRRARHHERKAASVLPELNGPRPLRPGIGRAPHVSRSGADRRHPTHLVVVVDAFGRRSRPNAAQPAR